MTLPNKAIFPSIKIKIENLGVLYEEMIANLNSEIVFLKEQSQDIHLTKELLHLQDQLDIYAYKSILKRNEDA